MRKCALLAALLILTVSLHAQAQSEGKPANIILMIGDGMGSAQLTAMLTLQQDGVDLRQFGHAALMTTYSADDYITDSAASGTAIACGRKTKNGYLGVDAEGKPLVSIFTRAREKGMLTGLVASCAITHATPGSFAASVISRNMYEEIAEDMASSGVDVMIGGGYDHFAKRKDGRNLIDSLRRRDYQVPNTLDALQQVQSGKVAALLYPVHPPYVVDGRGDMLRTAAMKAVDLLDDDPEGFMLMIEASQIDWACHGHQREELNGELKDFALTIAAVLEYAKKDGNTLVIVTADHETGAYSLQGGDWERGKVKGSFDSWDHTGSMVPLLAYGPGSSRFPALIDNAQLNVIMADLLGLR